MAAIQLRAANCSRARRQKVNLSAKNPSRLDMTFAFAVASLQRLSGPNRRRRQSHEDRRTSEPEASPRPSLRRCATP